MHVCVCVASRSRATLSCDSSYSYFCSNIKLWVHIRTASMMQLDRLLEGVLTSTQDLGLRAKVRKHVYPSFNKVGCKELNYMGVLP